MNRYTQLDDIWHEHVFYVSDACATQFALRPFVNRLDAQSSAGLWRLNLDLY